MKMQNKNLSLIAYSNGFTIWLYNDRGITIDKMEKEGFFDNAKTLLNVVMLFI